MALRPPEPRLYTDSITIYPRTLAHKIRGDGQFTNGSGTLWPKAIVTQRVDFAVRNEDVGQPVTHTHWDVKILSASDPGVHLDDIGVDNNGRTLRAVTPTTAREAGDWIFQAVGDD